MCRGSLKNTEIVQAEVVSVEEVTSTAQKNLNSSRGESERVKVVHKIQANVLLTQAT